MLFVFTEDELFKEVVELVTTVNVTRGTKRPDTAKSERWLKLDKNNIEQIARFIK